MKKRIMAMLMTAILVIASIPFTAFAEEMPAEVLGGEVMEAVAAEAAEAEAIPAAAGEEAEAAAEVTKTTLAGVDSTDWEKLQNAIDEASPAPISGVFDVSYEEGTGIRILKLLKNITAESGDIYLNVPDDSKLILDLNGKTLDRGLKDKASDYNGNAIKVGAGASFTVKNGTITGANASDSNGALRGDDTKELNVISVNFADCKGCAISLSDVKCANIEGCTFTGNEGNNGGAIDIKAMSVSEEPKAVTIKDSLFKNNKATNGSGSAIRIYGNHGDKIPDFRYADVTIIDSEFTENVAEKASDASTICAYRLNSLVLDGCTITKNTAVKGSNCAGFSIGGWVDKLTIKGKTVIKDNTVDGKPADMSLYNKDKITFKVDGLDPESEIGIKLKNDIEEGQSRVIVEDFNAEDKDCFFSDDLMYQLTVSEGSLFIEPAENHVDIEYKKAGEEKSEHFIKDGADAIGGINIPEMLPEGAKDATIIGVEADGNVEVNVKGKVDNLDYGFSETGVVAGGSAKVTVDSFIKNAYGNGAEVEDQAVVTADCFDGWESGVTAYGCATVIARGENASDAIRGHENFGAYVTDSAMVKAYNDILTEGEGYAAINIFCEANGATVEVDGNAAGKGKKSIAVQIEDGAIASNVKISKDAIGAEGSYAVALLSTDLHNTVVVEGTAKGKLHAEGGSVYVGKLEGEIKKGVENVYYLIGFSADGAGLKEFNFSSGVSGAPTGVNGKVYNAVSANQIAGSQITITPKEAGKKINTSKLQLPAGVTKVEENGALILKFDANFKGGLQNMVLTFGDGPKPDPTPSSDDTREPLFTGTWGNPVKNGAWKQDANGIWSYTSTETFRNTWGYIANPYAHEGQNQADWFYFDQYGHMLTGWQFINGKWYYLNPTKDGTLGACFIGPGKTPDGWEVDASGAWTGR